MAISKKENLAILGGEPVMKGQFPQWPIFNDQELSALREVLESHNWWRTPGTKTAEFERSFATYHQAQFGIAVTNGTAGLEVALLALDIGPGDEVIVPDFTFVATASAVLSTGALPVLVDIDPNTYCLNPKLVKNAISPRTRAIIVVHLGGNPANMSDFKTIANDYGLWLVEDSSHAHSSEWKNTKVGAIGDIGTFSFQQSKLMTAGEGGIIITNNENLAAKARSIHDCGRLPEKWFYDHYIYGSNYRLTEWQGAILLQQLKRLPKQTIIRTKNALFLDDKLKQIEGIEPQETEKYVTRNGHYAYIFHVNREAFHGISTKQFIKALNAEGIPTQDSYPPLHGLDLFTTGAYRKRLCNAQAHETHVFMQSEFPGALKGAWETVWLPHPVLLGSEEQIALIVKAIEKIQKNARFLL